MARHAGMSGPWRVAEEPALPAQMLEAALRGELDQVEEILDSGEVDVNFTGTVSLRIKCTETVLLEELADEVRVGREEFRTDITALFAAAHSGHAHLVRKLLSFGADVNQELFRGYATTAAAREGHCDTLNILLKAGASQRACKDALLEASLCGEAEVVQLLISADMVRSDAVAHALVTASCRGFVDVVSTLIKNQLDINCMDRVLLRSIKPALHANVDCTPLVAAIVSRQVSIVKYLLEAGARIDCQVRVGAWSWDPKSDEELRVGACLGEPYTAAWCAVEYYEASGKILKLLLHHEPSLLEDPYLGRTLLCHAILCQNHSPVCLLLDEGANSRFPIRTKAGHESHPIHLATRLGSIRILRQLISHGCDVNAKTSTGETSLMISAKMDHADCFLELITAGADLGMISNAGDSPIQLAKRSKFASSIINMFSQALISGAVICSTDLTIFSPLHFVVRSGDAEVLQMLLHSSTVDLDNLDGLRLTPLMVALEAGHVEIFRLLVMAGADIAVESFDGKTLMSIIACNVEATLKNCFEQILLDAALANILTDHTLFGALHYAARKGDLPSLVQILKMGYFVNSLDEDGYTPLMYAAIEGQSAACKILLLQGNADCGFINDRRETALSLARRSNRSNKMTEGVLLDQLARLHVLAGEDISKYTREGCGPSHMKTVRMLASGVLTWGKTGRRNVVCKEAAAGPSLSFAKNRRMETEDRQLAIFRVVTVTGREVHFEASCISGMELWVRAVNLIAKEAASSSAT